MFIIDLKLMCEKSTFLIWYFRYIDKKMINNN